MTAVAYRPGGRQLAVARHDKDALSRHDRVLVEVYDLVGGRPMAEKPAFVLRGHTSGVNDIGYSPDGRIATVGSDGTLRIWDADVGRELLRLEAGRTSRLAFSPDGRRIATTDFGTVRLWEAFPLSPELLTLGRLTE
jgi:WD40 repeat protein